MPFKVKKVNNKKKRKYFFQVHFSLCSTENEESSNEGGRESFDIKMSTICDIIPFKFQPEHEKQDSFVNDLYFNKETK